MIYLALDHLILWRLPWLDLQWFADYQISRISQGSQEFYLHIMPLTQQEHLGGRNRLGRGCFWLALNYIQWQLVPKARSRATGGQDAQRQWEQDSDSNTLYLCRAEMTQPHWRLHHLPRSFSAACHYLGAIRCTAAWSSSSCFRKLPVAATQHRLYLHLEVGLWFPTRGDILALPLTERAH